LDTSGCIGGTFQAEAEELHILGNHPKDSGEFFAAVRCENGDTVAMLHAIPDSNGLTIEFASPATETATSSLAEVVHFSRIGR
jgi:hypothetical protein